MIQAIKKSILNLLPPKIHFDIREMKRKSELKKWHKEGGFPVPHIIKQETINEYRDKFQVSTFIETGTYMGDMIEIQKDKFKTLASIELSQQLFEKARKRFKHDQNIKLYQGDSGEVLHKLVPELNEVALFWLDGHYSAGVTAMGEKETPIINELKALFKSELDHVILIDDARCFDGTNDYPKLSELRDFIKENRSDVNVEVKNDIIIIVKD